VREAAFSAPPPRGMVSIFKWAPLKKISKGTSVPSRHAGPLPRDSLRSLLIRSLAFCSTYRNDDVLLSKILPSLGSCMLPQN
jgi:hypothetical protein